MKFLRDTACSHPNLLRSKEQIKLMKSLKGIFIPAVTPFDSEGNLLIDKLLYNISEWTKAPIAGIMVLGSNGEMRSLSDAEALRVIETAVSALPKEMTLIVGVGRESLYSTLEFIRQLEPVIDRVDYLSVLTPNYFPKLMTDDALYAYYSKIADVAPKPVLLYTAPSYANQVVISPELISRLADHPNIAGIKDTSSNMMEKYMDAAGGRDDFEVMAGSVSNLITCLERGGIGGVVSAANYFPAECCEITESFFAGDIEKAKEVQARMKLITSKTAGSYGVAGVKAVMGLMGYQPGVPRLPILPVAEEVCKEWDSVIREAGIR